MEKKFVFEHDYERILRDEAEHFFDNRKGKVLNIACEFNLMPDFLKGLVDPKDVFGAEINEEIVKVNPNVRFCNVDRDPLPFADGELDLILSIWGIEHFQTENVFKESCRALKPGGRVIILTPNIVNPLFLFNKLSKGFAARFYFKYLTDSQYQAHQTHYNFNKAGTVAKAAVKNGLRFKRVIYFGPSFFTKYFEFNRFLEATVVWIDKMITNPVLGCFKPYIICVLEKE